MMVEALIFAAKCLCAITKGCNRLSLYLLEKAEAILDGEE